MSIFDREPKNNQIAYFADHTGEVHKVTGKNRDLISFLFKTHILFKSKKAVETLCHNYKTIDDALEAEEKPVKKFLGVIGTVSNVIGVVSALPSIIKIIVLIVGFLGVTGTGTKFFMDKKNEFNNAHAKLIQKEKEVEDTNTKQQKVLVELCKKYNVRLGYYKDLRGYTCNVYDVKEDTAHNTVWIMSVDQYNIYHADSIQSFFGALEFKYKGENYTQKPYSYLR
jgi:hypothetical protein